MDGAAGASAAERRWAAGDRVAGVVLLALGGLCLASALLGVASLLAGEVVHPDAVLIPLAVGLVPAAAGALFLLASRAMRRGTAGRWTAQWGALLVPLTLAAFVWLSLQ